MSRTPNPLTAATARLVFYDIEALPNVFTFSAYDPTAGSVEVFHLVDGLLGELFALEGTASTERITRTANPALPSGTTFRFHDLHTREANETLADLVGMFAGDRVSTATPAPLLRDSSLRSSPLDEQFRPTCDTDPGYDPRRHPLLAGYNSRRYDTVMLALHLMEAFAVTRQALDRGRIDFQPTTAAQMFAHNTSLFSEQYRQNMAGYLTGDAQAIRRAMLDSGRHIDVSGFNEGVMIGLKRVLAGMGRQILEFDDFQEPVATTCDLRDLIAYNVSDVVGLAAVFSHPVYSGTFDLKAGLLATYPECVYEFRKPALPRNVRSWRLTLDSTSAQFAARILAPGKALADLPAISFDYPHPSLATQEFPRRNILDDTLCWFIQELGYPWGAWQAGGDAEPLAVALTQAPRPIQSAVRQVIDAFSYYRDLQGRNVNDSGRYTGGIDAVALREVSRTPNNLPYFRLDGTPTSGYVNFSVGGIHGAEFDLAGWRADADAVAQRNDDRTAIQQLYPDPLQLWNATSGDRPVTIEGREWTRSKLLTPATRKKDLVARREQLDALGDNPAPGDLEAVESHYRDRRIGYRNLEADLTMFVALPDGSNKLHPKYSYTSVGTTIHEDFTSYYPNLLRNMAAFANTELGGEDRYATIFEQKQSLTRELKAPGLSEADRDRLKVLLNGTKLILNSASGAADTMRDNAIRMNNRIVSMRIIGQLLTWRIGQAQTFAGATVVSTNTDGLYTTGLDPETNNRVLAEQAALINIGIEPEPTLLASKDSNNRVEFEATEPVALAPIISASGGSLAAFHGPTPKKSLAHPAVLDWALARYLREVLAGTADLEKALDPILGRRLIDEAAALDPFEAVRLFQHVLVSSPAKRIVPFGISCETGDTVLLPHTSRVFFVRPGTPGSMTLQAATTSVTELGNAHQVKELRRILARNGWAPYGTHNLAPYPQGHHANTRKVTGISAEWPVIVANHDLLVPPQGAPTPSELLDLLDPEIYLAMLADSFEANWRNDPVAGGAEAAGTVDGTAAAEVPGEDPDTSRLDSSTGDAAAA